MKLIGGLRLLGFNIPAVSWVEMLLLGLSVSAMLEAEIVELVVVPSTGASEILVVSVAVSLVARVVVVAFGSGSENVTVSLASVDTSVVPVVVVS